MPPALAFLPQLWTPSTIIQLSSERFELLLCPPDVRYDCRCLAQLATPPKTAPAPGPEMQSTPLCVSPGSCVLISCSRMRSCQYNNHRERKPFLPPTSHINEPHLHTAPAPVRQQLKAQPSGGGGVGEHEPQIYKLDFYPFTSRSLPSTRQLGRRRLCGLRARGNYSHLCQRCITYDRKELSCDTCDPVTNE